MNISDITLIELFNNGDSKSMSLISDLIFPELYRLAFLFTGERMEAEDIVQDSLVILWERRVSFSSINAIRKYVNTVVRNKSIDFIKSANRKRKVLNEFNYLEEHQTILSDIDQQKKDCVIKILDERIQKLPYKTKQILTLSLAGKSAKEIADLLKIERKAIHKIKARGVIALRKVVENNASTRNY